MSHLQDPCENVCHNPSTREEELSRYILRDKLIKYRRSDRIEAFLNIENLT